MNEDSKMNQDESGTAKGIEESQQGERSSQSGLTDEEREEVYREAIRRDPKQWV